MVRHKNDYRYWEEIDSLPVPGCSCNKCTRAADREVERQSRRSQRRGGWQTGGSVDGQAAKTKQSGARVKRSGAVKIRKVMVMSTVISLPMTA